MAYLQQGNVCDEARTLHRFKGKVWNCPRRDAPMLTLDSHAAGNTTPANPQVTNRALQERQSEELLRQSLMVLPAALLMGLGTINLFQTAKPPSLSTREPSPTRPRIVTGGRSITCCYSGKRLHPSCTFPELGHPADTFKDQATASSVDFVRIAYIGRQQIH